MQRFWFGSNLASDKDRECLMPEATHERNFSACLPFMAAFYFENPHLTCLYNFLGRKKSTWMASGAHAIHAWAKNKMLNPVVKMPPGLEEPSAEGYLSVKSFCGINSMARMRSISQQLLGYRLSVAKGVEGRGGSWKGQLMLSCATKSQPASKLGIPRLAVYPLACLWLYHRGVNRALFDVWHAFICRCCPCPEYTSVRM